MCNENIIEFSCSFMSGIFPEPWVLKGSQGCLKATTTAVL